MRAYKLYCLAVAIIAALFCTWIAFAIHHSGDWIGLPLLFLFVLAATAILVAAPITLYAIYKISFPVKKKRTLAEIALEKTKGF